MQAITISELISARIAAKRVEDEAVAERRRIDGVIADLLKDANKPEGSISQKADGYKVTVTYKIDRKVDTDKLQAAWAKLSATAAQAFKWKADVSVSELRKLEGVDAAAAAVFITSKPASPSITIEAI
jgi:hypothetical protein